MNREDCFRTYFMSVLVSFELMKWNFLYLADFVKNLITRKQFVAAVRFSCAYSLANKNQLVVMLREHVQNVKLICDSSCEKTNSIEIKVLIFFLFKLYFIKLSIFANTPAWLVINKLLLCTWTQDKAKDQEIASLRTVLQCILDCNLQSEDMLDKEIKYRILELKAIKGN
jgi:hypothetical protein